MSTQSGYYTRRAAAERVLGGLTTNPKVAAIHDEMAKRYDALSESTGEAPPEKPPRRMATRTHRLGR